MSQQHLLVAIAKCLESGEYTDLTIKCGNDVHDVHKMVVCTQSDVLAAAIRFGGKESEDSCIDLPDDEPTIVGLLVNYLYTGDYACDARKTTFPSDPGTGPDHSVNFPHTCVWNSTKFLCDHHRCSYTCISICRGFVCKHCGHNPDNASDSYLLIHAKMYEIADKYNITGLKELSSKKFSAGCELHWSTAGFAIAAHYALSTTVDKDKGLRDVVTNTIVDHIDLIRKPEIEALMTDFGWLSYRVLLRKEERLGQY